MTINYENNNCLQLKGKITQKPEYSHSVLGEGFFETTLEVKRLSAEVDLLPVTISERLLNSVGVGDEVGIIGQFRSYNKLENGKSRLMLTVFARELTNPEDIAETNYISLVGYICKEPIYRTTPFGREIADLLLAVNRAYNKSDYIPCIAWGRNARFVKDLQVGEKLEIVGRVQSRNYQKKTETETLTKTAYEISISSIMLAKEPDFDNLILIDETKPSTKKSNIVAE